MIRLVLASLSLALVAGCASTSPSPAPAPQAAAAGTQVAAAGTATGTSERKQICVREMPTGSTIPVNKCHFEETDAERARALDSLRMPTMAAPPGAGK
jgi:hypothetical protein